MLPNDSHRYPVSAFTDTVSQLYSSGNCTSCSAAASRPLYDLPGLDSSRPSLRRYIGYVSPRNLPPTTRAPKDSSANAFLIYVDASTSESLAVNHPY